MPLDEVVEQSLLDAIVPPTGYPGVPKPHRSFGIEVLDQVPVAADVGMEPVIDPP
jgi:hypothetical protein